jgi:hypothetical protein
VLSDWLSFDTRVESPVIRGRAIALTFAEAWVLEALHRAHDARESFIRVLP